MSKYINGVPQGPDWFDWLPRKVQCFLLLCLTLPASAGLFWGGMHCVHTGKPVELSNTTMDASEFFLSSAFALFLSGCLFAVMVGWMKPGTPHVSETHKRKP